MQHISRALNEGDPRSLEKIVAIVQRDPSFLEAVIDGLTSNDPLIRRRAAIVVEKISRKHPAYLHSYKHLLIEHAISDEPEVCVSLIPLLSHLPMDDQERAALFEGLRMSLFDASDMLKIVCLQALITFAQSDPALRSQMIALLEEQSVNGILVNQHLANEHLARFGTSSAVTEDKRRTHTSLYERWQRAASLWRFGYQYMKVAMNHFRRLREQERERRVPPIRKTILKELGNLFYGIVALTFCVVFVPVTIESFSHFPGSVSLIDYVSGAFWFVVGLFGSWLFIVSVNHLVKIGVRMYQIKRANEMEE